MTGSLIPMVAHRVMDRRVLARLPVGFASAQPWRRLPHFSRFFGEKWGSGLSRPQRRSLIIKGFSMPTFLDRMVAAARARVADSRPRADLGELERRAQQHVPRGFRRALAEKSR